MEEFYNMFHPLDQDELGVDSVPTMDEIKNNNYNKMYSLLNSKGYRMTEKMRKCSDGEEFEITEIREPKAFGFFFFFIFLFCKTVLCV